MTDSTAIIRENQCTATSKTTRERCRRIAEPGWTVCRNHGAHGGAPLVNAGRSKFLPRNLAAAMESVKDDPDLQRLDYEAALATALLDVTLGEYRDFTENGTIPEWWEAFDAAQNANDRLRQPVSCEQELRRRIFESADAKRKTVESVHSIETQKHKVLSVREAEAMAMFMIAETQRLVTNIHDRNALLTSMYNYLSRGETSNKSNRVEWEGGVVEAEWEVRE